MPWPGNSYKIYRKMWKCCHPSNLNHIHGVQMAYNDLSESKMTISTPYGPCRGADFYKNDTLSRSRNPENDTLFSGTSPYRKIYKCPPGGKKPARGSSVSCMWQVASLIAFCFHDCSFCSNDPGLAIRSVYTTPG